MVSFLKLSLHLFVIASNISSILSINMPPRMLKTSSLTEEEHYLLSRSTHRKLLALLPDKNRFLRPSRALLENSSVYVEMTKEDKAYMREHQKAEKLFTMPFITGVVKNIEKAVGKGKSKRRLGQKHIFDSGVYEETGDGFTWTLSVKSSYDALGLSVFIKNAVIPYDVSVSFFNAHGDFDTNIEARISNNEVWTKTVNGNEAFLAITYKGLDIEGTLSSLSFSVSRVSIFNPDPSDNMETRRLGDCNWGIADCVVDYMCCKKNMTNFDQDVIELALQECGNWQNANEDSALFRDDHITNYSRAIAKMSWYVIVTLSNFCYFNLSF